MAHHHVIAIQDWGGTQMSGRGWDEHMSLAAARTLVAELVEADTLVYGMWTIEEAEHRYGDRLAELISDNVNPGWEAIWIIDCEDACRFESRFAEHPSVENWGQPAWTPQAMEQPRSLRLVP